MGFDGSYYQNSWTGLGQMIRSVQRCGTCLPRTDKPLSPLTWLHRTMPVTELQHSANPVFSRALSNNYTSLAPFLFWWFSFPGFLILGPCSNLLNGNEGIPLVRSEPASLFAQGTEGKENRVPILSLNCFEPFTASFPVVHCLETPPAIIHLRMPDRIKWRSKNRFKATIAFMKFIDQVVFIFHHLHCSFFHYNYIS